MIARDFFVSVIDFTYSKSYQPKKEETSHVTFTLFILIGSQSKQGETQKERETEIERGWGERIEKKKNCMCINCS